MLQGKTGSKQGLMAVACPAPHCIGTWWHDLFYTKMLRQYNFRLPARLD